MEESQQSQRQTRKETAQSCATGVCLVLVSHPKEGAEDFASDLVAACLAACVNLVETKSVYRWKGKLERSSEALLIIKAAEERLGALETEVRKRHPYDVPEFVVLNPMAVEANYLTWLLAASKEFGA